MKIIFKNTGDHSIAAICMKGFTKWFLGSFDNKEVTCKRCLKIMGKKE